MREVGFGIAGAGAIADIHAQAVQAAKGGRLVGVWSRTRASAERLAERYDVPTFSDYEELLDADGLDAVAVCTPSGNHLEPSLAAARKGKHIIVEKPIEVTLERADQVIEACRSHGVMLGVIFQSRFMETTRKMKEALDRSWLGAPVMGTAEVKWFRDSEYYAPGSWHGTLKLDGGGALINQAIHTIDLLVWLMGDVESVQGFTTRRRYEHLEGEDTAVASLRFKSGALGTIMGATSIYPGFSRKLGIYGTAGSIVLEGNEIAAALFEDAERQQAFQTAKKVQDHGFSSAKVADIDPHREQYEDFIEAVREGRAPGIDGVDGRRALEVVLAIYRSAAEGRIVRLPL